MLSLERPRNDARFRVRRADGLRSMVRSETHKFAPASLKSPVSIALFGRESTLFPLPLSASLVSLPYASRPALILLDKFYRRAEKQNMKRAKTAFDASA